MKIISEFGINPILLLAQIVNFAVLLFLLNKFLYKPLLKALDERKTKVSKSLRDAEEIEARLEKTAQEQEKILDKARTESALLIAEAKKESKELSEKMVANTKASISEMLEKTQKQMSLEKEQMVNEVKKDLAELVMTATARVARQTMNSETSRKIVEEAVDEVTK